MCKIDGEWIFTVIMFTVLACAALSESADQIRQDEITVAIVNGAAITQDVFDGELARIKGNIAAAGKSLDDSQLPLVIEQVMENIIGSELLYQESRKSGIEINETQINEEWEKVKKQFSSEAELQNTLNQMNISEDIVKNHIEHGLAIQQFINENFNQKISVSDTEAKAYYDTNPDTFKQPPQVKASHILIKFDSNANESQKKASREEIRKIQDRVKKGEDFAALAREFSQCPSSSEGGDLGYFSSGQMVKPFEEAAFALNPGDVSDIVETQYGYHLIKVTDKKDESILEFDNVKSQLQAALKRSKVNENLGHYVAQLREEANVEILMK